MKDVQKIVLVIVSLFVGLFAGAYINNNQATRPWQDLAYQVLGMYEDQLNLNREEQRASLKQELGQSDFALGVLSGAIVASQQIQALENLANHLAKEVAPRLHFNKRLGINYKKTSFNLGDPVRLLNKRDYKLRYDKNGYIVPTPGVLKGLDRAIFINCDGREMRVWHLGFGKMLTFKPTKTMIRQRVIIYSP